MREKLIHLQLQFVEVSYGQIFRFSGILNYQGNGEWKVQNDENFYVFHDSNVKNIVDWYVVLSSLG